MAPVVVVRRSQCRREHLPGLKWSEGHPCGEGSGRPLTATITHVLPEIHLGPLAGNDERRSIGRLNRSLASIVDDTHHMVIHLDAVRNEVAVSQFGSVTDNRSNGGFVAVRQVS